MMSSLYADWCTRVEKALETSSNAWTKSQVLVNLQKEGKSSGYAKCILYDKLIITLINETLDLFIERKIKKKIIDGKKNLSVEEKNLSVEEIEKFTTNVINRMFEDSPRVKIFKKYVGNIQNFRVECNAALDEFDDVDEYNENWMIRLNKFQETAHSFELDMPELSKLDLALYKLQYLKVEYDETVEIGEMLELSVTNDDAPSKDKKKKRKRKRASSSTALKNFRCASSNCKAPNEDKIAEWIICDGRCSEWFHFNCTGVTKLELKKCSKFVCKKCAP